MRESKVERDVTAYAKRQGWLAIKIVSPNFAGLPDRLYIRDGEYVFVEFKRPGGKLRKLQVQVRKLLRRHGAVVLCIDDTVVGKGLMQ